MDLLQPQAAPKSFWDLVPLVRARASRPHQACHSPVRISHRIAGCSMKGIYFQYLIGFLMRACKYRRRWARSGLSFSPRSAHARSTVETATLFAREHALREKFLRHPALFSRVQPPGEKCGLVALRSPLCPFVDFFFWPLWITLNCFKPVRPPPCRADHTRVKQGCFRQARPYAVTCSWGERPSPGRRFGVRCCRRLRGSTLTLNFSMGLRPRLSAAAAARLYSNPLGWRLGIVPL